jgi:hypothetical protein
MEFYQMLVGDAVHRCQCFRAGKLKIKAEIQRISAESIINSMTIEVAFHMGG